MNVAAIKSYQEASFSSKAIKSAIIKSSENNNSAANMIQQKSSSTPAGNSKEIVSKSERNYFMKLFPQNSAQIERHEIFTRNGKVSRQNLNKGRLVDFTV